MTPSDALIPHGCVRSARCSTRDLRGGRLFSRQPHSTALAPRLWLKYAVLRRTSRRSGGRMRMSERAAHTVLIPESRRDRLRHAVQASIVAACKQPCAALSVAPAGLPGRGAACPACPEELLAVAGSAGCLRSGNAGRIVARCCMGGGAVADPGRLPGGRVVADARQRDLRAPARRRRR